MGIRSKLSQLVWTAAPEGFVATEEVQSLLQEVNDLKNELDQLRKDVNELRRDSLRIAELTDLTVERLS